MFFCCFSLAPPSPLPTLSITPPFLPLYLAPALCCASSLFACALHLLFSVTHAYLTLSLDIFCAASHIFALPLILYLPVLRSLLHAGHTYYKNYTGIYVLHTYYTYIGTFRSYSLVFFFFMCTYLVYASLKGTEQFLKLWILNPLPRIFISFFSGQIHTYIRISEKNRSHKLRILPTIYPSLA